MKTWGNSTLIGISCEESIQNHNKQPITVKWRNKSENLTRNLKFVKKTSMSNIDLNPWYIKYYSTGSNRRQKPHQSLLQ